ncbi:beta-defensin 43-like [Tupaia chinensis]|uniref:beta-defensin 43-like n=1 Tax=Tupaia chinensis TaxID=246437 RepID=UPI0003C8F7EF|nr:beta-defensin 43-like [Tupaia chinensis]
MRVSLSILGVLALLCIVPPASSFSSVTCPPGLHHCRMKCNANEYAVRYCDDWSICCKARNKQIKKTKKW